MRLCQDVPRRKQDEDELERWDLAGAIARYAARRHDVGVTFGVYGEWGSGKTTFLHFVEAHLEAMDPKPTTYWMNSWLGHSWEVYAQLLMGKVFEHLGSDYATWWQRRAKELSDKLEGLSLTVKGGKVEPGKFLSSFAQVDLIELRRKLVAEDPEAKPIVVFVDDVDRQEVDEIRQLFRLLNFFSGLGILNFVVAVDPCVAAQALSGAYAVNDGRKALEKFVQVPITLPPPPLDLLANSFAHRVTQAIEATDHQLQDFEHQHFRDGAHKVIFPLLRTPRQVSLVANALTIAALGLRDEVNLADLIYIVTLQVLCPSLHGAIYQTRQALLGSLWMMMRPGNTETPPELAALLDGEHPPLTREQVKALVIFLFPQTENVIEGSPGQVRKYGPKPPRHGREKRLCDEDYFDRYFAWGLRSGQLRESDIDDFVQQVEATLAASTDLETDSSLNLAVARARELASRDSYRFILGLERRESTLGPEVGRCIGAILAASGDVLAEDSGKPSLVPSLSGPRAVASHLLARLSFPGKRFEFDYIPALLRVTRPLPFAYSWAHPVRELAKDDERFWQVFTTALVARLKAKELSESEPVYIKFPRHGSLTLQLWEMAEGEGAVREHLRGALTADPATFPDYLHIFRSHWTTIGSSEEKPSPLQPVELV